METPVQVVRYDQTVWEISEMDKVRRDNCMCLHCGKLKPNLPDNCPIAQSLYTNFSKVHGNAFIMTRCDQWMAKI